MTVVVGLAAGGMLIIEELSERPNQWRAWTYTAILVLIAMLP